MKKLKPVVLITIYNEEGTGVDFDKMPYNGDQEKLTNKIQDMLNRNIKKHGKVYALPVTGFEY